jgi:hypothetical protein
MLPLAKVAGKLPTISLKLPVTDYEDPPYSGNHSVSLPLVSNHPDQVSMFTSQAEGQFINSLNYFEKINGTSYADYYGGWRS